jgi:hypothetical protein
MKFTKQEYADLHLLCGEARGNSRAARPAFSWRSPSVPLYFCGATSAFWFQYDGVPDPSI